MDYKGLITETNEDQDMPLQVREQAMKEYPSSWGYAAVIKDDKTGENKLVSSAEVLPPDTTASELQETLDLLGSKPLRFEFFGKFPEGFKPECCQPFTLLTGAKNETLAVCFIAGDTSKYVDDTDRPGFSGEYICYKDHLMPKILELNDDLGGDQAKIINKLKNSKTFTKDILNMFGDRCVVSFLFATGEDVTIEDTVTNEHRLELPWGTASDIDPPKEAPTDKPEEKEEKEDVALPQDRPLTIKERRLLAEQNKNRPAGVHTTTATPKQFITTKDAEAANRQRRADQGAAATASALKTDIDNANALSRKAPVDLIRIKDLFPDIKPAQVEEAKKAWNTHFGSCPDQYKLKQADGSFLVNFDIGYPRAKLKPSSRLAAPNKGLAALEAVATAPPKPATAAATPASAPASDAARSAAPAVVFPIISGQQRDKGLELLKTLDAKSNEIMSVAQIKTAEEKENSFYDQMGITMEESWRYSDKVIAALIRQTPDLAHSWIKTLRNFQQIHTPAKQKEEAGTTAPLTIAQRRAARKSA